ncbi:hypothetical protein [Fervidobacterium sp.]
MDDEERYEYIKALERAETGIRTLFKCSPKQVCVEEIDDMFSKDDTKGMVSSIWFDTKSWTSKFALPRKINCFLRMSSYRR